MKSRNVGAMSAQKIIKLLAVRGILVVLELESMELNRRIASAYLALIEIESGRDKKEVIKKIRDSYLDSLTDDDFIELPSHLGCGTKNRDRNFNHDMLQTMFPNDDVDSEDFEDGIDMEDCCSD